MVAPPVHDLDGAFQSMVVSEASTSPGGVLARRAIAAEAAHEEPATVGAVDPPVGERELLRLGGANHDREAPLRVAEQPAGGGRDPVRRDLGVAPVAAASLLAAFGVFDLVGTIGAGWLSDRYDNRWLLTWYYGFRSLSLLWLVCGRLAGRPGGLRRGLRPRLRRHRPAHREADGRRLRPRDRAIGRGLDLRRPPAGRRRDGLRDGVSRGALGTYLPDFLAAHVLCPAAAAAAAAFALVRRPVPAPAGA